MQSQVVHIYCLGIDGNIYMSDKQGAAANDRCQWPLLAASLRTDPSCRLKQRYRLKIPVACAGTCLTKVDT